MTENILSPSPNWYCSKVSDTNKYGDFAFGARNLVYLFNTRKNPPSFRGTLTGHSDRVTGVAFCKHVDHAKLLASAADDHHVKLWDIEAEVALHEHNCHQSKITAIDWSGVDKHLIYTSDETGVIIQWNYVSGDTKQFLPENGHIFSLACSPHNVQFLAVGYKLGNILIIDIKNRGCVIHKLRGHDDEVHSLSWAPTLGEDIRQKKGKKKEAGNGEGAVDDQSEEELGNEIPSSTDGCLLASGSRDRTIRLWSTSKGKAVLTLKLPSKASGFKGKMEDTGKSRVWLTLYWPKNKPRELLSSSHGGDLLMWDLCKPGKQKWKLLGQSDGKGHNRIVFNIVPGGDAALNTIVTVSMDRQIILWNLKSCRAVSTIPTLGGFVYTIVASPIDPGRLAVGVGDNMIRIWNTSSPSNTYDVTVIWQGIRSKVTALSWHPFREGHLAYGTDDGRVGIHDVFSQKPASVSNSYHKRTVYCVDWGPPCPPIDNKSSPSHCVYSCGGEGIILQHNPYRLADDAIDINSVIRKTNNIKHKVPQRSEVSWKPDGTVCAVGNDDGSVEVFQAPHLLLLCTIQIHHKIINRIEWYPDFTHSKRSSKHSSVPDIDSGDNEDCRNWLAVGGNDPPIHVYDLTAILCAGVPLHTPVTGSYITLNGHSQRVTGLSWSPHGDKKLASVSYDGTAQVWDVMNGEPIANYRAHHGRLFSVIWSVLHPDVVYTGGEDFTLQKWRISQQEFIKPPKNKRAAQSSQRTGKSRGRGKNRQNRDVKSRIPPLQDTLVPVECVEMMHGVVPQISPEEALNYYGIVTDNQYAPSVGQILPSEKKIISSQLFEVSMANVAASESSAADVMETAFTGAKRADKRRKKQKSLFPNCSSLDNRGKHYVQEDCRYLAKTIYSAGSDLSIGQGEHTNLGMFSDRKAAFRMFKQEGDYHLEQGNIDNFIQLEIWKGNIGRALQVAKDKGQLNDWLVSMAPLGGQNLWIQSCECYAKQLCSQEQYMKAVSYYLSAHKVYDAINVLKEHKLYKEAVALSKVRLSPKDPVLLELYWEWAAHLESDGNYEQAAKCYLATDNRCDAIRSLARRGDITSLKIASQVAVYANELDQASSLALQCANQCQESGDWLQAHEMLLTLPNLKGHHLQLILHEMLVKSLLQMNFISSEAYQDVLFTDHPITMQDRMQRWCNALSPGVKEYLQPKACGDDFSRWPICTFDNGDLFYCRAIRIWLHYHNIEYDELSDVYEALSQSKPTRKEHLSQKEILLHLSHEMTLALLSLVTSQTPVNHWFQAIILCHERGYYDMEQNIFTIMLPQGWKTFSLLRMLMKEGTYYKDENVHSQQLNKLDSLEAYYCLLVVYSLWWSREDNKKSQQLAMSGMIGGGDSYKANGDSAQHVADGECKDLAEGGVTDITKYGFSSDRDAEQEKDTDISESRSDAEVALQGLNGVETSFQNKSQDDVSCYENQVSDGNLHVVGSDATAYQPPHDWISCDISKLQLIVNVLLSDIQAQKSALNTRMMYIQKAVKGLILRQKRLDKKEQKQRRKEKQLPDVKDSDDEKVYDLVKEPDQHVSGVKTSFEQGSGDHINEHTACDPSAQAHGASTTDHDCADPTATDDDPTATDDDPTATDRDPPSTDRDPPSTDRDPPSTDRDPPSTDRDPPSTDRDPPSTDRDPPSTDRDPPSTDRDPPSTDRDPPSTDRDPPSTDRDPPSTDRDPPSTDRDPPSTDRDPPSTDRDPPSADRDPPSADRDPPSADREPPSADRDPPSADRDPPSADRDPPSTDRDPPSTDRDPPSTDHDPPSTDHDPLATEYDPLATEHAFSATDLSNLAQDPMATVHDASTPVLGLSATKHDPTSSKHEPLPAYGSSSTDYDFSVTDHNPSRTDHSTSQGVPSTIDQKSAPEESSSSTNQASVIDIELNEVKSVELKSQSQDNPNNPESDFKLKLDVAEQDSQEDISMLENDDEDDLPPDWKDMPVDVRYSHPAVTLPVLSEEQAEVIEQLQQFPNSKEFVFPEPVESAMILGHYCINKKPCVECGEKRCQPLSQLSMDVVQWGLKHAQTSQEIKYFLRKLEILQSQQ